MQNYNKIYPEYKKQELNFDISLTKHCPFIIRLDAIQTTKLLAKPFDLQFAQQMQSFSQDLQLLTNAPLLFTISDEVSLLFNKRTFFQTDRVEKIISQIAGLSALCWNKNFSEQKLFDARVFSLSPKQVEPYFYFRQQLIASNLVASGYRELAGQYPQPQCSFTQALAFNQKQNQQWQQIPAAVLWGTFLQPQAAPYSLDLSQPAAHDQFQQKLDSLL